MVIKRRRRLGERRRRRLARCDAEHLARLATARPNRAEPVVVQETKKSHVVSGLLTKNSLLNFYGAEFDGQVRGAQRQRAARLIWISELARALSLVACCASSTRGTAMHDELPRPSYQTSIVWCLSTPTLNEMESFACGGRAGVWSDRGVYQCFSALAKHKRRFAFGVNLGGWGMQRFCSTSPSVSPGA